MATSEQITNNIIQNTLKSFVSGGGDSSLPTDYDQNMLRQQCNNQQRSVSS